MYIRMYAALCMEPVDSLILMPSIVQQDKTTLEWSIFSSYSFTKFLGVFDTGSLFQYVGINRHTSMWNFYAVHKGTSIRTQLVCIFMYDISHTEKIFCVSNVYVVCGVWY